MALGAIEQRKAVIESRAQIREFVFGVQDGLISTVGLLAGIQGATESNAVVIITGLTAMFAGAISMAAGSYLSSSAEKEIFDKELREAEMLAEREPYLAAEGLLKALNQEGRLGSRATASSNSCCGSRRFFSEPFKRRFSVLGSAEINRPLQAALVMAASFIVGALIPIVPYFVLKGTAALYFSIALSALTLFGMGVFKGRLAGKSQLRSGMQFFAIAVSGVSDWPGCPIFLS